MKIFWSNGNIIEKNNEKIILDYNGIKINYTIEEWNKLQEIKKRKMKKT